MLGTLCLSTKEPITTKHRFSGSICAGFGVLLLQDHKWLPQGSAFFPRGWAHPGRETQNTRGVGGWRASPKTQNAGGWGAVLQLGPPARLGLGLGLE